MFHAVVAETDDIETGKQEDEEKDMVYSDFVVFNWSRSSCFHLSLWSHFICSVLHERCLLEIKIIYLKSILLSDMLTLLITP